MRGVVGADDPIARVRRRCSSATGARYVPTQLARGPWSPKALHGGAPSALFATVCETHDPGPAAFVARLTVELMRPVPLAPLELRVRTIRPGRKVQWIEAMLLDEKRPRGRARDRAAHSLRRRRHEWLGASRTSTRRPRPTRVDEADVPVRRGRGRILERARRAPRRAAGGRSPGPGIAWFRLRCPVIAGEPISPIARVAAAADFGSGVANPVRHDERGRDQSRS